MKYLHRLFVLLIICNSYVTTSFASDEIVFNSPRWWVNIAFGSGTTFSSGVADIKVGHSSIISFNGAIGSSGFLTFYTHHLTKNNESTDGGIMFGYIKRNPNWYYSASAGLAAYKQENRYFEDSGVGLPIQIQTFWTPFKHVGFGIIGHTVLGKDPVASLLAGIQFYA